MRKISRREFLHVLSGLPGAFAASKIFSPVAELSSDRPTVIILVLDALSARNMSLYGYPRATTPNIERFSQRANVYHAHYSGGTFTTSGTASLLTGTYPWTHRAINIRGVVRHDAVERNIFNLFRMHHRAGFTQNYLADYLLAQFGSEIDRHYPIGSFSKLEQYVGENEVGDSTLRFRANTDLLFDQIPGSLILGLMNEYRKNHRVANIERAQDGLQHYADDLFFRIEDVFSGLVAILRSLESSALFYVHLFPPHDPYQPQDDFDKLFVNGWKPKPKPRHNLWKENSTSRKTLSENRLTYDQYLANTDYAFGQFVDQLQAAGVLENSFLVLTSDHGESFERGYLGHSGPYVYEPSIHIPLLISAPSQRERNDYYSVTNSIDVLPTLLDAAGYEVPDWCEGRILPGFVRTLGEQPERVSFSMDAKNSSAFKDLPTISIAMRRGNFKLIYYVGYNAENDPYHDGVFELYNLEDDPEELNDLINEKLPMVHEMKSQLLSAYELARRLR